MLKLIRKAAERTCLAAWCLLIGLATTVTLIAAAIRGVDNGDPRDRDA